jgi:hypothetical protein
VVRVGCDGEFLFGGVRVVDGHFVSGVGAWAGLYCGLGGCFDKVG